MKQAVKDELDSIHDRWARARIDELSKHDVPTLAEFGTHLENVLHTKTELIEDLQQENAELRDKLNGQDTAATEMRSSLEYLGELMNLSDDDEYRAELVDREVDTRLANQIREATDQLIILAYHFAAA